MLNQRYGSLGEFYVDLYSELARLDLVALYQMSSKRPFGSKQVIIVGQAPKQTKMEYSSTGEIILEFKTERARFLSFIPYDKPKATIDDLARILNEEGLGDPIAQDKERLLYEIPVVNGLPGLITVGTKPYLVPVGQTTWCEEGTQTIYLNDALARRHAEAYLRRRDTLLKTLAPETTRS